MRGRHDLAGIREGRMNKLVPFHTVLLFGGAGFIGSNWAYRLLKTTDAKIHIFDNLSRRGVHQNLHWLQQEAMDSDRLKITIGDVRDANMVRRAVQSASEIYHFAAQVAVTRSVEDPRGDFEVNVGGTLNILEAARNSGRQPSLLFTSTNKVYGQLISKPLRETSTGYACEDSGVDESQPLDFYSPYGCSKGAADQYVHDYNRMFGLPTVVFRMSCIAGARQFGNEDQGWVAHFLYSALQGRPVTLYGNGRQVRDILCVDDLVRAFERVRSHATKTAGQIYNVGGGAENAVSLLDIIDEIEDLTGKRLGFRTANTRPGDQLFYVTNASRLRDHTGWEPRIKVRETLEHIYEWWRGNQDSVAPVRFGSRIRARLLEPAPGAAS
jgi:CDP-paratose 2-epimerase